MIKTRKKKSKVREVVSCICDKCKKEYGVDDYGIFEMQEFHHIHFMGGFSSVFGDGSMVECDICQHCLKELIREFCRVK